MSLKFVSVLSRHYILCFSTSASLLQRVTHIILQNPSMQTKRFVTPMHPSARAQHVPTEQALVNRNNRLDPKQIPSLLRQRIIQVRLHWHVASWQIQNAAASASPLLDRSQSSEKSIPLCIR